MLKRKRIIRSIIAALLVCGVLFSWGVFAGCAPADPAVKKIEIDTLPQTEYYVDEEFSALGGKIKVTYDDDSEEVLDMVSDGVSIDSVSTAAGEESEKNENGEWNRWVTVRFGKKYARFQITVTYEQFTVTFDYGYDEIKANVTKDKGSAVSKPTEPEREDYTFNGWYTDENCTVEYDFSSPIAENLTLYADWLDNSAKYFDFIFDYNYYGVKPSTVLQRVEENNPATILSVTPVRTGYRFDGWFTNKDGTGVAYAFANIITQNTTVYAKWTKTVNGANTYVFEAENTDLTGKSNPALSGTYTEGGMILTNSDVGVGASGGRFVVGMYKFGNSLEFYIACDEAVSDATLMLRLSAELRDAILDPENFAIIVNDVELDYPTISLTNVPAPEGLTAECLPFADFTVAANLPLFKGSNTIQLMIRNDVELEGTTVRAIGPLVDCVKITTSAVLIWNANAGLPKTYQ